MMASTGVWHAGSTWRCSVGDKSPKNKEKKKPKKDKKAATASQPPKK